MGNVDNSEFFQNEDENDEPILTESDTAIILSKNGEMKLLIPHEILNDTMEGNVEILGLIANRLSLDENFYDELATWYELNTLNQNKPDGTNVLWH